MVTPPSLRRYRYARLKSEQKPLCQQLSEMVADERHGYGKYNDLQMAVKGTMDTAKRGADKNFYDRLIVHIDNIKADEAKHANFLSEAEKLICKDKHYIPKGKH